MQHPPRILANLASVLLILAASLCPAAAAPPEYRQLQADPDLALPMQPGWQLQPADENSPPWQDVFAFTLGMAPERIANSRWLSLNPGDAAERAPALFDTAEGRVLALSPSARSVCDGRWRVVWLESIGSDDALRPTLKVWLVERRDDGSQTSAIGYGRIDGEGRWAEPPRNCVGEQANAQDSPAALSYRMAGEPTLFASDLRVETVLSQPGLRDTRGRWRTAEPQRDIATAQWLRARARPLAPGATATGLIDARGRTVIPFIFHGLDDATAEHRIRLCTAAGDGSETGRGHACRWQALRGGDDGAALRPVQDAQTGRWGYQDARGAWAIAPQFQHARPFRQGYAVVEGLFPEDWRPPGWQDGRPIVRSIQRAGRHWVAEAMLRNASTGGRWAIRYGVLDETGRWLAAVAQPPLSIVVPFPAGGRSGFYAELLAQRLPNLLGREVQVDYVAQADVADYRRFADDASDARVLLAAVRLPRGGIAGVQTGPPIEDALRALQPVTLLASQPLVLAIDRDRSDALGIRSLDELLAYARAHPGALSIATGIDGWTGHLAYGQFRALSGVDVRRKIFDDKYPDSDRITREHAADLLFAPVNGVAVAVQRGQLRVLGTTADPAHPLRFENQDWPSLASNPSLTGYAAYDSFSLWAPARSQAASNRALQQAVAQVLDAAPVRKQLADLQVVGGGGPPEELLALEDEERERWLRALSAPTP